MAMTEIPWSRLLKPTKTKFKYAAGPLVTHNSCIEKNNKKALPNWHGFVITISLSHILQTFLCSTNKIPNCNGAALVFICEYNFKQYLVSVPLVNFFQQRSWMQCSWMASAAGCSAAGCSAAECSAA